MPGGRSHRRYIRSERRGARSSGFTVATASPRYAGAGVVTPPRRDADGHWGLRAPGTRLPQRGTRVAPQLFTEARDKDVGSDRRNVPWSPENIFIDTVTHLQRDFADIRAESRQFRTPGVPPIAAALPFGGRCFERGPASPGVPPNIENGYGGRIVGTLWIARQIGGLQATV